MQVIGGQLTSSIHIEDFIDAHAPGMVFNDNGDLSLLTTDEDSHFITQRIPPLGDLLVQQVWRKPSIDAQPAELGGAAQPAEPSRTRVTLRPRVNTPRYDRLIECIDSTETSEDGRSFRNFIKETCFHSDLLFKSSEFPYEKDLKQPLPLAVKMESLLKAAEKRREMVLQDMRQRGEEVTEDTSFEIPEEEMKTMYQKWTDEVESWMRPACVAKLNEMEEGSEAHKNQDIKDFKKSRFSAYTFHLSGHKTLLHLLIKFPIIAQCMSDKNRLSHAADPSTPHPIAQTLMKVTRAKSGKIQFTEAYKKAVDKAQQLADEKLTQSMWIYIKTKEFLEARNLAQQGVDYKRGSATQKLVEKFKNGTLEAKLLAAHQKAGRAPNFRTISASKQARKGASAY